VNPQSDRPLAEHVRNLLADAETRIERDICDATGRECPAHLPMTNRVTAVKTALHYIATAGDVSAERLEKVENKVTVNLIEIAVLRTRVGMYATIGAAVGAAAGSVIGAILIYALTKTL